MLDPIPVIQFSSSVRIETLVSRRPRLEASPRRSMGTITVSIVNFTTNSWNAPNMLGSVPIFVLSTWLTRGVHDGCHMWDAGCPLFRNTWSDHIFSSQVCVLYPFCSLSCFVHERVLPLCYWSGVDHCDIGLIIFFILLARWWLFMFGHFHILDLPWFV